jgi:tRNA-dihydrouridine synthase
MKNPKLCGDIIRAIKEVTDKPVTAKIRLGWNNESINFLDVIKELEEAGVDMIAIHARTRKQMYEGKPRWELLKDLRSKMNVPLVVSGNIFTVEDANKALEITGADAVMIARGGIGNPFLVHQINVYQSDKTILEDASLEEQVDYCLDLASYIIEEKGEDKAMLVYRSIAPKFFSNLPMVKKIKTRLANELKSYKDLENIIYDYLEELRK